VGSVGADASISSSILIDASAARVSVCNRRKSKRVTLRWSGVSSFTDVEPFEIETTEGRLDAWGRRERINAIGEEDVSGWPLLCACCQLPADAGTNRDLLSKLFFPLILPDLGFSPLRRVTGQRPIFSHGRTLGFFLWLENLVRCQQGQKCIVCSLSLAL